MEPRTYAASGVDQARADSIKRRIAQYVQETFSPGVLRPLGLFGGIVEAPGTNGTLALVATIDSVGTKVIIASVLGHHEGIGIDLVHHSANDLLACGAEPLFFLDYFATAKLEETVLEALVRGMTRACGALGCALIGGETAQLPGVYTPGAYDLAGCMVGVVPVEGIIDGRRIEPGDLVLGLPSDGLHTNGYSLVRAVLGLTGNPQHDRPLLAEVPPWSDRSLGDLLLQPHRCYVPLLRTWLRDSRLHGLAHITGGGLTGNLSRIVPDGCRIEIDASSWPVPPLFEEIRQRGSISPTEMFRVFNMGIGFAVIGTPSFIHALQQALGEGWIVGHVVRAERPRVIVRGGMLGMQILTDSESA
jgi:phosphoribosylformylglycinamidine cyclo-ligase